VHGVVVVVVVEVDNVVGNIGIIIIKNNRV
jgi:hypothetical protein